MKRFKEKMLKAADEVIGSVEHSAEALFLKFVEKVKRVCQS
ncbi:MAG: hypothetical protein QXR42_09590 [Candidatus Bathyarchaeia archaeon]